MICSPTTVTDYVGL